MIAMLLHLLSMFLLLAQHTGADGRVSAAHVRKKKRLNEDLEEMLTSIESRRADQAATDTRMRELVRCKTSAASLVLLAESSAGCMSSFHTTLTTS